MSLARASVAINRIRSQEVRVHVKRKERKRATSHRLHMTASLYRVSSWLRLATYPRELMEDVLVRLTEFISNVVRSNRKNIVTPKNDRT